MGEFTEQCLIFKWAKLHHKKWPCLEFMFSTLNGVRLPISLARKAKISGNKKGVPDIVLPYPNKKYHGLYIELKHGYNKPSPHQVKYKDYLNSVGYLSVVVYGSTKTIELIKDYVSNKEIEVNES